VTRRSGFLVAAACCAFPVTSHLAVVTGDARWAALGLSLLAWSALATRMRPAHGALLALLFSGLALTLSSLWPAAVLFAPPLAIYLALAATFAATLRRGDEPLVGRFARIERGAVLPPDLDRYTRVLTWLWVLFFVAMATVSFALALAGPRELWSLFTNLVSYVLLALFFACEYLYRRIRFRHLRHAGLVEFLRRLPSYRPWAKPPPGRLADGS
jgi:uncharacterized membrane protein